MGVIVVRPANENVTRLEVYMKIIRWLLSHSLFILLIVAVIYAYMFWGNLLGKDTPAGKAVAYLSSEFVEVEEFVNAIKAKQAQLSEEHSSDQDSPVPETAEAATPQPGESIEQEPVATEEVVSKPVEVQPVIEPQQVASIEPESIEPEAVAAQKVAIEDNTEVATNPVEPQPAIEQQAVIDQPMTDEPMIDQQQVNISDSQTEKSVKTIVDSKQELKQESATVNKTQAVLDETDKTVVMAVTHRDTEEKFVSADVAKQLDNVDEHGEVIDPSQPGGAVRENWITARKSFYQRNYKLSEQSYQQVIDNTKNNYDAYGELGNVYFNQGKNKQAASAYFEAAAILVNKGRIYRARSLMGLLRHLDKSKATELQKLIASTKT